eukprot:scaffold94584_cov22-Cyclotella_meneghiniana.AAC.1
MEKVRPEICWDEQQNGRLLILKSSMNALDRADAEKQCLKTLFEKKINRVFINTHVKRPACGGIQDLCQSLSHSPELIETTLLKQTSR